MERLLKGLIIFTAFAAFDAFAAWDFRGEPNAWGQTRMTDLQNGEWEIVQHFAADEDEFKIARDDGWQLSFPSQNFQVEAGKTYRIVFDEDSRDITAREQTSAAQTWNFRGTANAWGETPLERLNEGRFRLCQQFADGDEFGGPRFKIAKDGWNISLPDLDIAVERNSTQEIVFDENLQTIDLTAVSSCAAESAAVWNFRGTPNGWRETPMEDRGNGQFETCQFFGNADDGGAPRFKIVSAEFSWDLAFPEEDRIVEAERDFRIIFDENQQRLSVFPVASCSNPDAFGIVGQHDRVTLKNTPYVLRRAALQANTNDDFTFDLLPGPNYRLDGQTIIPDTNFTGELLIGVSAVNVDGETAAFDFRLQVIDFDRDKNLIVHDADTLAALGVDLSLTRLFNHLASNSNEPGLTGVQLFRQFWDIQNTPTDISVGPNCGDETLEDGVTPAVNGFPVVCDRLEAAKVKDNDAAVALEMASYFPIAAVNRFDLHRPDFSDCGEHRMIFARGTDRGPGRNFLITEARVANPEPGNPAACEPLINFWLKIATLSTNEAAAEIESAYYRGIENFPAIMSIQHFVEGAGQIRTNQFISFEWMLREHKLDHSCADSCVLRALPVSVKENPFGRLFNGTEAVSGSEFSGRAALFQDDFITQLSSLTNNSVAELSIKTDDRFNNGQSHASGRTAENNFVFHFTQSEGSDFFNRLNSVLEGSLDANGVPLTAAQVLNRATALTCGGCHQPSAFGLTFRGSIGAMRLPNGEIIDSWPASASFVHVSEFRDFRGNFRLSSALSNVFLPIREDALRRYLRELAQ